MPYTQSIFSSLRNVQLFALSLLVGLLFSVSTHAQEPAVYRVMVISMEDGTPLPGAAVLLFASKSPTETDQPDYYGISDRDGFTEIRGIESGVEFQVIIRSLGLTTYSTSLTFAPGEIQFLRAELEAAIEEFGEVLVEETRTTTVGTAGLTSVSSIDIARVPVPGIDGDLVSFLQTESGVVTSGDRGGNLYIRGGTPDQNMVLVDNLRIIKPFHISNLFSAFPGDVVQNVDFYAGGFGAKYNGAASSVIDVALRPGNMRKGVYSASFSPYLASVSLEGPIRYDQTSYYLSARTSTIQTFAPSLTGEDVNMNFGDILGRYTIQNQNITCNITGMYTFDSGEISPLRSIDQTWSNTVIGTRCLAFDDTFNYPIVASAGYSNYEAEEASENTREQFSGLRQFYFDVETQFSLFNQPIDYGFGFDLREYNIELSEKFASFTSREKSTAILDAFISTQFTLGQHVLVNPGVVGQTSIDGFASFEPRLRVSVSPGKNNRQQISLAIGKYAQYFSGITDERDVGSIFTVINPIHHGDKLPISNHAILTYDQKVGAKWQFSLEGYLKEYKNTPVSKWNPQVGLEIETAYANGLAYGLDAGLEFTSSRLFAALKYGWGWVEYEAASEDLGAWIEDPVFSYHPLHDLRHKLNALFSYEFGGFTTLARWEFGTGKPYTQIFGFDMLVQVPFEDPEVDPGTARILFDRPFEARLPYYHRLDVSMNKEFELSKSISLTTSVGAINTYNRSNLFNFDYFTLSRVDQTPFFPYLSAKLARK